MSEDFQPLCQYFNTTRGCKFGETCKFQHRLKEHTLINAKQTNEDAAVENTTRKNVGSPGDRHLCHNFISNNYCKYGHRCRYIHAYSFEEHDRYLQSKTRKLRTVQVHPQKADKATAQNPKKKSLPDEGNKLKDAQEIKSSGLVKKRLPHHQKICWFYRRGHCKEGESCKFKHTNVQSDVGYKEGPDTKESNPNVQYREEEHADIVTEEVKTLNSDGVADSQETPTALQNRETTTEFDKLPSKLRLIPKTFPPKRAVEEFSRSSLSVEEAFDLRHKEIELMKKRFPSDKLDIVHEDESSSGYLIAFSPSDPDWPYDVKEFQLMIEFPKEYPLKMFKVSLPVEEIQKLPETVRRYIEVSLQEWLTEKQQQFEKEEKVMLIFRMYLRWVDRNIEDIVTEGLKQYKRELLAGAAGFQFIPASQLRAAKANQPETKKEESDAPNTPVIEMATKVYKKPEEDEVYTPVKLSNNDKNKENEDNPKQMPFNEIPRGTELMLQHLQLKENAATLLCEKIMVVIRCLRCKNRVEVSTPGQRANSVTCVKCNSIQLLKFRPTLIHQFSNIIGYLDLEGCAAFDVNLLETSFSVGCLSCSQQILITSLPPGQLLDLWCRSCHCKMRLSGDTVRIFEIEPAGVDKGSGQLHHINLSKPRRVLKDPTIQEGKSLPNNGTCKHYKKSFRWLRFPCCGNAYPCDVCHDDKEGDHEMKFANRMICGYCCKEQTYASEKPCIVCHQFLTKKSSSYWEGGRGCRDKIRMSRNDTQKYANQNKTVSRKAESASGNKNTKLRHKSN